MPDMGRIRDAIATGLCLTCDEAGWECHPEDGPDHITCPGGECVTCDESHSWWLDA